MGFEKTNNGERRPCRDECLALLPHIPTVLNGLNNRGPRRRSADAEFFQTFDKTGLGESRWRRCAVAIGPECIGRDDISDSECREQRLIGVVAIAVVIRCRSAEHGSVALELDRGAARRELAVGRLTG